MFYLLDGNNIVKSTQEFLELSHGDFTLAMRELVDRTSFFLKGNNSAIVFFDGFGFNYKFSPPPRTKIVFSKEETADSFIIAQIKKIDSLRANSKFNDTVIAVSDDIEIRNAAKFFGCQSMRTFEYVQKLFPAKIKKEKKGGIKIREKEISVPAQIKITEELKKLYKEKGKM